MKLVLCSGSRPININTYHGRAVLSLQVLLVHTDRAIFYGSPYLDTYGEQDLRNRRGAPLYLYSPYYEHLKVLWARGGVPDFVVRQRMSLRRVILRNHM